MSGWELFAKAYAGGLLIGVSALALSLFNGRIAGISGIVAGAISLNFSAGNERFWRWFFVAGMLLAGFVWQRWAGPLPIQTVATTPLLLAAGLLVGFGTRLGSGCTSGHGVCGIARLSARSIVATIVFMASGIATVALLRLPASLS